MLSSGRRHLLGALALTLAARLLGAQTCNAPHYRWPAKTSTTLIHQTPEPTTISAMLTRWPVPPLFPGAAYWCAPRVGPELQVYRVQGWLRLADTTKDDGDWHLELTEGRDDAPERCIVVEIPAPRWDTLFASPRDTIRAVLRSSRWKRNGQLNPPALLRVMGPPFFDAEHIHGHRRPHAEGHGRCNSSLLALWEIHPVYRVQRSEPGR